MMARGIRALQELAALTRGLRNLRVLALSGGLGTLAAGLLNPAMPMFLHSRGLDLRRIGLVYTLASLLPILLQPVVGALSDRFSRKRVLVGFSLATSLLLPAFTLADHTWMLAIALATKLTLSQSVAPVSAAMVGELAPANARATLFSVLDSVMSLAFVAALVASAPTLELLGLDWVFYLAGGLYLLSSCVLLLLSKDSSGTPDAGRAAGRSARWRSLVAPFAYARANPSLGGLFAYHFLFSFGLSLFPIYLPLFALELGAPGGLVGPLIASSWLVYALVQPVGGRISDGQAQRTTLIRWGLVAMALLGTGLGLSSLLPAPFALPVMVCFWVLLAIPDGLFRPSAHALGVELAPAGERGQFLGQLGSAGALARVAAPVTYGLIAAQVGLGGSFLVAALAFALAFLAIRRVQEPAPAFSLAAVAAASSAPPSGAATPPSTSSSASASSSSSAASTPASTPSTSSLTTPIRSAASSPSPPSPSEPHAQPTIDP